MGTPSGVLAQTVPMPGRAGPEVEALLQRPCPSSEQDSTPSRGSGWPRPQPRLWSRGQVPLARAGLSRGGLVAPAAECQGWGGASGPVCCSRSRPLPPWPRRGHGPVSGAVSLFLGCGRIQGAGCRPKLRPHPANTCTVAPSPRNSLSSLALGFPCWERAGRLAEMV